MVFTEWLWNGLAMWLYHMNIVQWIEMILNMVWDSRDVQMPYMCGDAEPSVCACASWFMFSSVHTSFFFNFHSSKDIARCVCICLFAHCIVVECMSVYWPKRKHKKVHFNTMEINWIIMAMIVMQFASLKQFSQIIYEQCRSYLIGIKILASPFSCVSLSRSRTKFTGHHI